MLSANLGTYYGLYDTRVYNPLQPGRYRQLVIALTGQPFGTMPERGVPTPQPELNVLTSVSHSWQSDVKNGWQLRETAHPLPRTYVTGRVCPVSSERALSLLAKKLDPWQVTLLEGTDAVYSPAAAPVQPAEILSYQPQLVRIRASSPGPAWLVLTDTAYPGGARP